MRAFFFELLQPEYLLLYIFAYGLAATPTAYLLARFVHKSKVTLKSFPSKSGVWRSWPKKSAVMIFLFDSLKGLIPCALAYSLGASLPIIAVVGFFAVIGHCYSVWLSFSGGRGASTGFGAMLFVAWPAALFGFIVFLISLLLKAPVERASFYSVISGVLTFSIWNENNLSAIGVTAMALVILLQHRQFITTVKT